MARKQVWLTWLPEAADRSELPVLIETLRKAGLDVDGQPWDRAVAKVGWLQTAQALSEAAAVDLWLVVGDGADFDAPDVRYGLSLARLHDMNRRTGPLAIAVGALDQALDPATLPPLLQAVRALPPPASAWGAKAVALAMRPPSSPPQDAFRLNIIAHPSLGQWFEVGPPAGAAWSGALLGIDAGGITAGDSDAAWQADASADADAEPPESTHPGEITHHGVGPKGTLPEQCTLEYPLRGMRVDAAGSSFDCWAVKNRLDDGESYFVRVVGAPPALLFGEHPECDEAEMRHLNLV